MRARVLSAIGLGFLSLAAHAALQGRLPATPGGTDYQAWYDTDLGILWLADANLAATNSFGVVGIGGGGDMTWDIAQSWLAALNGAQYLGYSDWRLPHVLPLHITGYIQVLSYDGSTDVAFNISAPGSAFPGTPVSEMAHLYYVTLGNTGKYGTTGIATGGLCDVPPFSCLTNAGPFVHIGVDHYWSGSAYPNSSYYVWNFGFHDGWQDGYYKGGGHFAWPVRDGDLDSDGDGVPDHLDNCIASYNPGQLDADGDGYGNACDADIDNNGTVTATDFALLRSVLGQSAGAGALAAAADLDGNGTVTATDFAILRQALGKHPGPSGLHPNCPPTCP